MNKKPKDHLKRIFNDIADGDIKSLPLAEANVSSLRARAGQLNREVGYQKYRVSVDSLLGLVRIANSL